MKDKFPNECIRETSDPHIKFGEKSSTIYFNNPSRRLAYVVTIDGCVIKDTSTVKCDFLLIDDLSKNEYFVELKGSDVGHAIDQLRASIERFSDKSNKNKQTFAYVVPTKVEPAVSTKVQVAKKNFRKKYNAILEVNGPKCTVNL